MEFKFMKANKKTVKRKTEKKISVEDKIKPVKKETRGRKPKGRPPKNGQAEKTTASGEEKNKSASDMKKLMDKGKARGYLTYQEVNEGLSDEVVSSEQIDDVLSLLGEEGIEIVDKGRSVDEEDEKAENKLRIGADSGEDGEGEVEADAEVKEPGTVLAVTPKVGKEEHGSDDPVRMYLHEMGRTPLLPANRKFV
jgi:hypothetical protein